MIDNIALEIQQEFNNLTNGSNFDYVADKGFSRYYGIKNRTDKGVHKLAKLSINEVMAIKKELRQGITGVSIAEKYAISQENISQIKQGVIWKDVGLAMYSKPNYVPRYPNEDQCYKYFINLFWGTDILNRPCPYCGKIHRMFKQTYKAKFMCRHCKKWWTLLTKTPMYRTKLPLKKWYWAIRLLQKYNYSSSKLSLALDINQASAHKMIKRIKAIE